MEEEAAKGTVENKCGAIKGHKGAPQFAMITRSCGGGSAATANAKGIKRLFDSPKKLDGIEGRKRRQPPQTTTSGSNNESETIIDNHTGGMPMPNHHRGGSGRKFGRSKFHQTERTPSSPSNYVAHRSAAAETHSTTEALWDMHEFGSSIDSDHRIANAQEDNTPKNQTYPKTTVGDSRKPFNTSSLYVSKTPKSTRSNYPNSQYQTPKNFGKSFKLLSSSTFSTLGSGKHDFMTSKSFGSAIKTPVSASCMNASGKLNSASISASGKVQQQQSKMIVAISEGRGQAKGEVGLCAMDLSWPSIKCQQLVDSFCYVNTFTALELLNPSEILLPNTLMECQSKLVELLQNMFENAKLIAVKRKFFNESKGLDLLREYCCRDTSDVDNLQHTNKYYALASACALLCYLEFAHSKLFLPNSLRIDMNFNETNSHLSIDSSSIRSLELVRSLSSNFIEGRKSTLFAILNYCKTNCGQRLLRSNILRPSSAKRIIIIFILFKLSWNFTNKNESREKSNSRDEKSTDSKHSLKKLDKNLKFSDETDNYGLKLARMLNFLPEILENAQKFTEKMTDDIKKYRDTENTDPSQNETLNKRVETHRLFSRLRQAIKNSTLEARDYKEYLKSLKTEIESKIDFQNIIKHEL
ncbi:MAG: MutS protein msh4 [Marteilia pararefringens]